MDNNKKEPLGYIFNSIVYYDENQLEEIINNIDLPQSYFFISQALQTSFRNNVFSLHESEIVSKSLRILNSHFLNQNGDESKI